MTKEQETMYNNIVASGNFDEKKLAEIRKNFEKPQRQADLKKAELVATAEWTLEEMARRVNEEHGTEMLSVGRVDLPDTPNVVLNLDFKRRLFLCDKDKEQFTFVTNAADVLYVSVGDTVRFSFGFNFVWDSEENVRRGFLK